jgi:tetratricopeptide (TPR) repeat protein
MVKKEKKEVLEVFITEEYIPEEIQKEAEEIPPPNLSLQQTPAFLEKTIVAVLLGLVFLLPIFFLPIAGVLPGFFKNILLSAIIIPTLVLTLLLWIKKEILVLPKSPLFATLFFLVIIYSFSSLISGSFSNSFFGTGGEITTSYELLLLSLLFFLFSIFFRTKERIFHALAALFASALLVFFFQIFHFIFPNLAVFAGILPLKTANLIGQWNDFGIFSAIIAILSLLAIEALPSINKVIRGLLYFFLVLALFFYSMVSYSHSWAILGVTVFSISVFVFFFQAKNIPTGDVSAVKKWLVSPSFAVALFSLLFVFIGPSVNNKLFGFLNIPPGQDVRPSFAGTYQVTRGFFLNNKKQSFFGVGPNRFFIPWQKYRTPEVNYTPWWGVDFNEGVGTIPSTAVSSGVLGFFGWVSFLFLFFFGGLRAMQKKFEEIGTFMQYVVSATFASASYCWIVIFLNTVGVVPFAFAFILSGLFLGALSASGLPQVRDYNYLQNPKAGFFIAVVLLLLVGSFIAFGYHITERARAFFVYHGAVLAAEGGNFEDAEAGFEKATLLSPNDAYYRSLSILNSYHTQQLILRKDLTPDQLREQFGTSFRASVENARKSIQIDGANYQNWLTFGNAYSLLVPLGIENVSGDAYTQAKSAYEEAAKRNPFNPQIPYILAKLALSKTEPDEGITYAKKALDLKNDYADALLLVSQIEDSSGHSYEALAIMEKASAFNFSVPSVLFQLGYLRYKNGNYEEAASALEKATEMAPDYANAKYFLGLSYFEFGRTQDALKEFIDIERLNPDRADITQIINNLQNGYAPLSSSTLTSPESASTTGKEKER